MDRNVSRIGNLLALEAVFNFSIFWNTENRALIFGGGLYILCCLTMLEDPLWCVIMGYFTEQLRILSLRLSAIVTTNDEVLFLNSDKNQGKTRCQVLLLLCSLWLGTVFPKY